MTRAVYAACIQWVILFPMNVTNTAKLVRADIWGTRGFPEDPAWIAHQMGLRVLDADLPDNVSGALLKQTGEDPVILLNRTDSRNRKRFSCAHELGHYASRVMDNRADHYEYIDLRGVESGAGTNPDELTQINSWKSICFPRTPKLLK